MNARLSQKYLPTQNKEYMIVGSIILFFVPSTGKLKSLKMFWYFFIDRKIHITSH